MRPLHVQLRQLVMDAGDLLLHVRVIDRAAKLRAANHEAAVDRRTTGLCWGAEAGSKSDRPDCSIKPLNFDQSAPGSFGSLFENGFDGVVMVLCEVLESLDGAETGPPDEGEGGVSDGGEHLGGGAAVGAALVFAAGHVADVVQAVLDSPMGSGEG